MILHTKYKFGILDGLIQFGIWDGYEKMEIIKCKTIVVVFSIFLAGLSLSFYKIITGKTTVKFTTIVLQRIKYYKNDKFIKKKWFNLIHL